uniref:Endoplasmic reticulum resident protein ERp44 n=1 Tax=Lepeophtheirus salmonis TaxID=72036 RepID=D3PJY9_LEPSM|nr:Endoplasmic reticulum resident protein ERp44 [Lepeophtheirus salmonis]
MKILFNLFFVTVFSNFYTPVNSGATILDSTNIDETLANNELVLINFYADWCRFSNMLSPIWDEAANKISEAFPKPGKVVVGKVDCDSQANLGTRFHITKYPTLKYVRNGIVAKKEYRGSRTAEAFLKFAEDQLIDPVKEYTDLQVLTKLEDAKRYLIGYFDTKESKEYEHFRRVASNLKDDCEFHAGFGEVTAQMHPADQSIIAFRPNKAHSSEDDESFKGDLKNYDEFSIWAVDKCTPLVRSITFENAEELTEEGLPFLILFHDPEDHKSIKQYTDIIQTNLLSEKQNVNFLTADGVKFAHPLHHLGKSKEDLPLIAIDSFRHMYLFPKYEDIFVDGKIKQFLQELYSGKLHREFHYGPDTTSTENSTGQKVPQKKGSNKEGTPPPSQFQHLGPSKNRYTLLRDEF